MEKSENPLVARLRKELLSRGASGIKGIAIYFKQIDDDGSKTLSLNEFQKGLTDHNIMFSKQESSELFSLFDKNQSGTLDFEEFLLSIRPPLNSSRMKLIHQAFEKLDKTRDKKITVDDLKGVYNVKSHPKYLSGEWTEEMIFKKFLDSFEISQHKDGTVTFDEFVNYYAGVSASIDSDAYFDVMMRQCWKL